MWRWPVAVEGCAIVVRGEPGVGKTALVREVCTSARGITVWKRWGGVRGEPGVLGACRICRPCWGYWSRSLGPQAAALSGAPGAWPGVVMDRFAVFAGVLSLVAVAAERQPLLVWVDDAQWLDVESARALAFCARRIYAEPILLVLAAREEEPLPFSTRRVRAACAGWA